MAEHLARIYGTEEDKTNCPFYYKIGACRHGDRCSRTHIRPHFSQTLLIPHMYASPPVDPMTGASLVNEKEHLTDFCEDLLDELVEFGALEEFHIVGNLGEHMLGNVYIKYASEEDAERALKKLNGRFYNGRQLLVEYSPVSDFREARCRQYDEETCNRGVYCNFIHMRPLPSSVRKDLERIREKNRRRRERERRSSRSRSPRRDRDRHPPSGHADPRDASRRSDRERDHRSRSSRDEERRSSRERESAGASSSSAPARSPSEERRAKFAELNRLRDAKRAEEAAAAAASSTAPADANEPANANAAAPPS